MDPIPDIEALRRASRAPATWRAYAADWRDFEQWCAACGAAALPATPALVGRYLAARGASLKPSTLARRLAAIAVCHHQAGHPFDRRDPTVADVLSGLNRTLGTAPAQKAALVTEDLRGMVAALPDTPVGLRDRALLLLGFAGAFRRSELVALEIRDVRFNSEGMAVTVRRGKGDQEAKGEIRAIPFGVDENTCPVRTLRRWLVAARFDGGPLFRRCDRRGRPVAGAAALSTKTVADVVKRTVRRRGRREGWTRTEIAEAAAEASGHSLRSGFITAAARAGASEWMIMGHTGHKTAAMVRRYIRIRNAFDDPLAGKIGL